jgi:hypothetical protein
MKRNLESAENRAPASTTCVTGLEMAFKPKVK